MAPGGRSVVGAVPARRASVLAPHALMSRTAAALFIVGGAVNTIVVVAQFTAASAMAVALPAVSTAIGLWLLVPRRQLSDRRLHLLLVFATVLIAAEVAAARDPFAAVLLATLSVFVSVAAFFFGWRQLVGHLVLVAVCMVTALALHAGTPWWSGVAVAGFVVVLTVIGKSFLDMAVAAEFDAVTGLPDRRGFDRYVSSWSAREGDCDDTALALIAVDAPRADVDATLLGVLSTWGPLLVPGDRLGRRDDDQIAILRPRAGVGGTLDLVDRLCAAAAAPCAAGVSVWSAGDSADLLIARAEAALLRAKQAGGGAVVGADEPSSHARRVRAALAGGHLQLHYQPVVGLEPAHGLVGVEALLRWPDASPPMSPTEVVRSAERGGFVAEMDDHILRTACRDAVALQQALGGNRLMLNVNASPMSLVDPSLVRRVDAALTDTGWPAAQLTFEITEDALDVRNGTAARTLQKLRARGVRVAVDDFGTGYSSLSRLHALPVDRLKLDKSIVDAITPDCGDAPPLLRAVAAMADALGLPVTAEGVETRQQLEALCALGFDQAQGFLFGTPRCLADYTESLASGEHWWDPDGCGARPVR